MYKALTIAGSDSSGGAGLQADLKTFQELGVYGMSAITTIVSMDPDTWQHNVFPQAKEIVKSQLNTILSIGVNAMKTGMLGSTELIELAAQTIDEYKIENVVVDPVMICKGDDTVLDPDNAKSLREVLVPRATVVTPNLFEAAQLSQQAPIKTIEEMKEAAKKIHALGAKYVVIKGGSRIEHEKAIDLFYDGQTFEILEGDRIKTTYTHGAGCTYSAAITAELAKGNSVREAMRVAKEFITAAIRHSFPFNKFTGPTNHLAYRKYVK